MRSFISPNSRAQRQIFLSPSLLRPSSQSCALRTTGQGSMPWLGHQHPMLLQKHKSGLLIPVTASAERRTHVYRALMRLREKSVVNPCFLWPAVENTVFLEATEMTYYCCGCSDTDSPWPHCRPSASDWSVRQVHHEYGGQKMGSRP